MRWRADVEEHSARRFAVSESGTQPGPDDFAKICGPDTVDMFMRQAVQMCWMMLPKAKKTVGNVESEVRRVVDRALKDFREDADRFGTGAPT